MTDFYSDEQRALQDQFETRKLADRLVHAIVHTEIKPAERAFIESRDMFFLATVDAEGQPTCSYKGGDPGLVHVVDPATLAFPSYDGTGMFLSLGNVRASGRVGMLFIDLETAHRLRVQVQDVLPPRDAGRTAGAGGTITEAEYVAKIAAGEA